MPYSAIDVEKALRAKRNPDRAKNFQWFFKTGPGEYGEGDTFLGVNVPTQRIIAKDFRDLPIVEAFRLLRSGIHEVRLTALIIIGNHFAQAGRVNDKKLQTLIAEGLLKQKQWINNWDLVDTIAPIVIGPYLIPYNRQRLHRLARSKNLWHRRMAIVSTLPFIRTGQFSDALYVSTILVNDEHDLIQKAVGWMLREMGKKDIAILRKFLKYHASRMPRTMLRYSIEKLSAPERKKYLRLRHTT